MPWLSLLLDHSTSSVVHLLDPRHLPEGSYEFTCVCLSVCQSVCLSGSLSVRNFSQNWHAGCFWFFAWSYGSIMAQNWQSPIFRKKSSSPQIWGFGPKNRVFGLLQKIEPKELAGNSLKRRVSTNQIARFFKLLYPLNRLAIFCNSLHKDRMP